MWILMDQKRYFYSCEGAGFLYVDVNLLVYSLGDWLSKWDFGFTYYSETFIIIATEKLHWGNI